MLRCRAAIALVAVVAATLVAPSGARAADSVGTIDRDVVSLDASGTSYTRSSPASGVSAATVSATNAITLATTDPTAPSITLVLGDGTRPQPGSSYAINSTTQNRVTGVCPTVGTGSIVVDRVTYAGDTVSELSASYGFSCTRSGWSSGVIRIGLSSPYAVARPTPVDLGTVLADQRLVTSVRFTNTGDVATGVLQPATVSYATVGTTGFSLASDGCGGVALAPGASCTVDVAFQRSYGTGAALVKLIDVTYPGKALVGTVTATALAPPTAPASVLPFPVAGGQGLAWDPAYNSIDSYRVLRADGDAWTDVSGPLSASTSTWVDRSLPPGASAGYAVIATNAVGDGPRSTPVAATRVAQDAVAGPYSVMTADSDAVPTSSYSVGPSIARDVTLVDGPASRRLVSSVGSRSLPLLPGPGRYGDAPSGALTPLPDSDSGCVDGHGVLVVDAVGYLPDGTLDTLTAHTLDTCGSTVVAGHVNYRSPDDVAALGITPLFTDLPDARVGQGTDTAGVTVRNTGGLPVTLGGRTISGPSAADWSVASDTCPDVLPVGGECRVDLRAVPTHSGDRAAQLRFTDSTLVGAHAAGLTVFATGLPSEPTAVTAIRLPFGGVDLSWDWPLENGGEGATHWWVRRQSGGTQTVGEGDQQRQWADPASPPDSTYTVSMENSIGDGPASAPVTPTATPDVIVSADPFSTTRGVAPKLAGFALDGRQGVPWSVPGVPDDVVSAAASPDGRSVAVVRRSSTGGYEMWRQSLEAGPVPVRLWTSSAPMQDIAWSPDGTRFVVSSTSGIDVLDATTGRVVSTSPQLGGGAWMPDSRSYVATAFDSGTTVVRVDASTGKRLGALPGAPAGYSASVSPDARWLTYRDASTSRLLVVPLTGGTSREVSGLTTSQRPVWAPDGRSFVVQNGSDPVFHSVFRVELEADGTVGDPVQLSVWSDTSRPSPLTWAGRRVAIGALPAVTGRVATVPVLMTSFPSGTSLSCAVDSAAFAACTTSWSTPVLTAGTHTVRVRTVEPGGRTTVAARTFLVDTTAPVTKVAALPLALVGTTTTLGLSGTDTGGSTVAAYDVRYRYASPTGSFSALSQPAAWQNLRGTSLPLTLAKGYSYCFAARARDAVGNVGAWSGETCTNLAFDDRALAGSGWTRATSSAFWLGTYTTAAATGRVLSAKVSARQVGVVVATCWTCGTLEARLNGVYVGRVSLTYPGTRYKQVVWFPAGTLRSGTLTLTTVGTKRVHVDGVVLRH